MSDTDKELDAMLTDTEDTATVEDPQADVVDSDDSDANADAPAGRQPNAKQDDTPDSQDGDAHDAKDKPTVPLGKHIAMRRALRDLRTELAEANAELAAIREQRKPVDQDDPADDEDDEDAPLTRADLRRIEQRRSQETAEQTRKQQLQRVEQALQGADVTQRRLLTLAEPYLTRADRKRIVESDDILTTALEVARDRVEMFGDDSEVEWLDGLTPPKSQSQKKSASQSRHRTNDRARQSREPVESDSEQADYPDVAPNVRGVLDHMFG